MVPVLEGIAVMEAADAADAEALDAEAAEAVEDDIAARTESANVVSGTREYNETARFGQT